MSRQVKSVGRNWYAIHTYSGYEDAVEKALRQRVESMGMQDHIFDVVVPKEPQVILKKGKPVTTSKKIFPGYVLISMVVTDESWYVVRNTPNVTGFVGSGNTPIPVSPEEFGIIEGRMAVKETKLKIDFELGELVQITEGPFATYQGAIEKIDRNKGKVVVLVSIFDRETPVELDFVQIKKKK